MALTAGALSQTSVQAVGDILASAAAVSGSTPYSYQWYRSTLSGFVPGTGNILSGKTSLTLNDSGLSQATTYYYKVKVVDSNATPATATSAQLAVTTITAGSVLSRATQKLFGTSAGSNEMGRFGDLFASYPSVPTRYSGGTISPSLVQALSNYLTGWSGAAIGGNSPAIEDMNALCYLFSYQLYYLMQAGIPEWDSSTTYNIGCMVRDPSSPSDLYVSLVNNNLNGPLTSTVYWSPAINTASIQDGSVTKPKLAALGYLLSTSSASFTTTSSTYVSVTNLSGSVTSTGRPVIMFLTPSSSSASYIGIDPPGAGGATAHYAFFRGATQLTEQYLTSSDASSPINIPVGSLLYCDVPAAGTYTYALKAKSSGGVGFTHVENASLVVYEL